MKLRPLAAVVAAFGLVVAGPAAASQSHHHRHGGGEVRKPTLDHGRKWATDAPLREQMGELRHAMHHAMHDIREGRFTSQHYRALGETVEYRVGRIVSDCKLPADADAELHGVVARLLTAAEVLQGRSPGEPRESAHLIAAALNQYGRHFDHPHWKPL